MKKEQFLSQPDVANFIKWLRENLPTQVFNINMSPSRYVPGGLQQQIIGLHAVLPHYVWNTSWSRNGVAHNSSDWTTTSTSLRHLRQWIKRAVSLGDSADALAASLEILRWGGVRGAIPFLNRLHSQRLLVAYLQGLKPLMALDSKPSQCLSDITQINVKRFDAGLTKIHALLDDSGSPIYDSRVGAAMAMLYALYRQKANDNHPSALSFPSGGARGKQIRDPRVLNSSYPAAPQFFTSRVPREEWARWQVRLGWILHEVLLEQQLNWFADEGSIAQRCHAFEACLFMIGYDLRCFTEVGITKVTVSSPHFEEAQDNQSSCGWVPTGHPFSRVLSWYREFREGNEHDTAVAFQDWLIATKNVTRNTARGYCFPLSENEFDLFGRDLDVIQLIEDGGQTGLYAALGSSEAYQSGDERERVCLVDAWIAGHVAPLKSAGERSDALINAGLAGTENSANTLLTVGRSVGRHFGLLDEDGSPTDFYNVFYGQANDDLM